MGGAIFTINLSGSLAGFGTTGFGTGLELVLGLGLKSTTGFFNFFPYFHISTTGFFNFFQRLEIGHGWGDFTLLPELPMTISRVANLYTWVT